MATTQSRPAAKSFGENIESDLALEFLRVVENAAIASARTMGQGERPYSDHVLFFSCVLRVIRPCLFERRPSCYLGS